MRCKLVFSATLCALVAGSGGPVIAVESAESCRAYELIDETTEKVVVGPEDIAIDRASGMVYVTAYDRRAVEDEKATGGPVKTTGGIYAFPIPDRSPYGLPEGPSIQVTDMTRAYRADHDFRPHGFHFQPGNPARLYVVNRVYEMVDGKPVLNPAIERFRLEGGSLVHEATIRPAPDGPVMCSPNDLWAKADGSFYVSNDHGNCGGFGKAWEETFGLKGAYLLYYDGADFRKVAENLKYANGVTGRQDPKTGERLIFVSETRAKKIRVFDEADLLAPGDAKPRYTIRLKGSPDNLNWTEDGDLLAATIPSIIGMGAYMRGWFGKKKTGSRTQRISWSNGAPGKAEIVFEDDGSMISGATSMAEAGGMYFIGAAFDDNIAICNIEALK